MFTTLLYEPLYNALLGLITFFNGNVGIATIALTFIVKIILMPLSIKALRSQALLKKIQPEIDTLRESVKDKSAQGVQMMAIYKKYNINPFSGCLSLMPQILVLLALYQVFYKGFTFQPEHLYSFVYYPTNMVTNFLGFDLNAKKVLLFAILAGVSQFMQVYLSNPDIVKNALFKKAVDVDEVKNDMPALDTINTNVKFDFATELGKSMQVQMVFILPIMIAFFSYTLPSAMALYWIVSSLITAIQEWYIRKTIQAEINM